LSVKCVHLVGFIFRHQYKASDDITVGINCILASCYIRFTFNICSFVDQCNIHSLLFIIRRQKKKQATWRPQRQHKYSNTWTLTISTPSAGAHGWHPDIGKKNWHNRAPAFGKYTITLEDGREAETCR
jgi:hypothetical protein